MFEQKRFNNISNFCGVFISVAVLQFYGGKKIDQKNSMFNNSKKKPQKYILKDIEVKKKYLAALVKNPFLFIREII